jgi:hypothetical protein
MDRKEKPKQGATADLLHQKPHVEVTDPKTSAVSSDEERLAAGISTIGLQAKRLSGAQRKKLIKKKKMKEATWTVENPQRKTPSNDKRATGCSVGVKRPHSDSSTPPLEIQQPKPPGTLKCRLRRTRKLSLESRWRLSTGVTLKQNRIKLRLI